MSDTIEGKVVGSAPRTMRAAQITEFRHPPVGGMHLAAVQGLRHAATGAVTRVLQGAPDGRLPG